MCSCGERLERVFVGGGPVLRADSNNCCGIMLTIMSWLLILFTLPFSLGVCLRVRLCMPPDRLIVRHLIAFNALQWLTLIETQYPIIIVYCTEF